MKTRRTILRGLAAAPVALAIPALASETLNLGNSQDDAALIAQAVTVESLTLRAYAVLDRKCELQREVEQLMPPSERPKRIEPSNSCEVDITYEDDGTRVVRWIPKPVDPVHALAMAERAAAIEAWKAERDAVARRVGERAADRLWSRLSRRLEIETDKLAAMVPQTLAGALAKCRAANVVITQFDVGASLTEWEHAITRSALRDLLAIGA